MKKNNYFYNLLFVLGCFALSISSHFYCDFLIQDWFLNSEKNSWIIQTDRDVYWIIFYQLPKAFFGIVVFCIFIWGMFFSKRGGRFLIVGLMVLASPILVAYLKSVTGVECPKDLLDFGGDKHFIPFMQSLFMGSGRCFPGGHVSAGFGLYPVMALCNEKKRRFAFFLITALGFSMNIYQLARGYHFLSHNLFTMGLSFSLYLLSQYLIERYETGLAHLILLIQTKLGLKRLTDEPF
jgi:membrane-associated PAP2 superfamily phosphatase